MQTLPSSDSDKHPGLPMSARARELDARLAQFMEERVLLAETAFAQWDASPQHAGRSRRCLKN